MKPRTLWNERFGVLIAGAGAGSALAYALGRSMFGPMMLRRVSASEGSDGTRPQAGPREATKQDVGARKRSKSWLARVFDRLETWSWERELRQREAYLAQAQDLADLEHRMRQLDQSTLCRGRVLR